MATFVLKRILGVLCLILGFLALVTPLTPGAWLMFIGLELLGLNFLIPKPIRDKWHLVRDKLLTKWRTLSWRKKTV
jgi:uncharacterized protein YqgC (DUF456 family)